MLRWHRRGPQLGALSSISFCPGGTRGAQPEQEQLKGRNVCRGIPNSPRMSLESPSDQSHHSVDLPHVVALQGQQVPPLIRDSVTVGAEVGCLELGGFGFLGAALLPRQDVIPQRGAEPPVHRHHVALGGEHELVPRFMHGILFIKQQVQIFAGFTEEKALHAILLALVLHVVQRGIATPATWTLVGLSSSSPALPNCSPDTPSLHRLPGSGSHEQLCCAALTAWCFWGAEGSVIPSIPMSDLATRYTSGHKINNEQ